MNLDNEEEVCQSCLGTGNITIPVFSERCHFPVLYEHEECPMCGGSGRRKQNNDY
jgi:DnaJ-class molecular chaperone